MQSAIEIKKVDVTANFMSAEDDVDTLPSEVEPEVDPAVEPEETEDQSDETTEFKQFDENIAADFANMDKQDDDQEAKELKPRSKGEEDFVKMHSYSKSDAEPAGQDHI